MVEATHIEPETAEHITPVLGNKSPEENKANAQEIIDYYLREYDEVQIVRCGGCGADLCLEILDKAQYQQNLLSHHKGYRRITLGDSLHSSRKRLDGVMGYQCKCGNNTIISEIERGIVPQITAVNGQAYIPAIEPHHEAMVRIEMAKQGYSPDTTIDGNKTTVETFVTERIK